MSSMGSTRRCATCRSFSEPVWSLRSSLPPVLWAPWVPFSSTCVPDSALTQDLCTCCCCCCLHCSSLQGYLKLQVCAHSQSPFSSSMTMAALAEIQFCALFCISLKCVTVVDRRCEFHDPQHLATKFLAHQCLLSGRMWLAFNFFN